MGRQAGAGRARARPLNGPEDARGMAWTTGMAVNVLGALAVVALGLAVAFVPDAGCAGAA